MHAQKKFEHANYFSTIIEKLLLTGRVDSVEVWKILTQ